MRPPLLPAASISQRPLEAYLPGSETPSFFQEASIAGNGNCGFTLLGITRDEFVDALAPLAGDAEIRSSVWEEIHEALTTQAELWSGPTTEWKVFFSAILALDAQIQRSLVTLGAQYGLDHSLQLDEFIISLEELGRDADADRLRQLGLEVALQRAHFESYCKRQDVFLSYLERLRINEPGRMLWLGNKSAVLYAKVKNITFYIWHRFEEDSNQLNLESSHVPEVPNGQVIHGLRTGGGTHYNFLVRQNGFEQDEEYDFDAGRDSFVEGLNFLFAANRRGLEKADEEFFPEEPDEEFFLKEQIQKSFSKYSYTPRVKYSPAKPAHIFYAKTPGEKYVLFDLETKIFKKPTEKVYLPKDQSRQLELIVREQQKIDSTTVEALSLEAVDQSAQFQLNTREQQKIYAPTVVAELSLRPISVVDHPLVLEPQQSTTSFSTAAEAGVAQNVGATGFTVSTVNDAFGLDSQFSTVAGVEAYSGNFSSSTSPHSPSLMPVYSGGHGEEEKWDVTELVNYLLRARAAYYKDLLAEQFGIRIDEKIVSSLLAPSVDSDTESVLEEEAMPLIGSTPPSSPPPSSPSGPAAEETSGLKGALIGSPVLLKALLRVINKFNLNLDEYEKLAIDFLETVEGKSITIVSEATGKEHNLSIENSELKYSERIITREELASISEAFAKEVRVSSDSRIANANKAKIDPTLWSEELVQGFEDFYFKEFELRAHEPRLSAMNEADFERHCIKKYAREMRAIGNREKFLIQGDDSLGLEKQRARIQELIKESRPTAKASVGEGPMPELMECLSSEGNRNKFNPKIHSSLWEFHSELRRAKLQFSLAWKYDAMINRGFDPMSLSDQQLVKDHLRYNIEADHHVEVVIRGSERQELTFSLEKDELKFTENRTNLIGEIERFLERFGPAGNEDFLRNFEPTSVEHRRYARATMRGKGLNELIVQTKDSKLWTLREDPATGFSCKIEECPLPQVTTTRTKPPLFRFAEMQAYYKHCLEQFRLRNLDPGRFGLDSLSFEKHCLASFERDYLAPKNPELFPELKLDSSTALVEQKLDISDVWDKAKRARYIEFREKQEALRSSGNPKLAAMDKNAFDDYCLKKFEIAERAINNRSKIAPVDSKAAGSASIPEDLSKVSVGEWSQAKFSRYVEFSFEQYELKAGGDAKLAAMDEAAFESYVLEQFEIKEKVTKKRSRFVELDGGPDVQVPKLQELLAEAGSPEKLRKMEFHQERVRAIPRIMEELGYKGVWQDLDSSKFLRLQKALNEELTTKGYGDLLETEARKAKFKAEREKMIPELMKKFGFKEDLLALADSERAELKIALDEAMRAKGYGDLVDAKAPKDPKPPTSKACADGLEEPVIRGKASKILTLQDLLDRANREALSASEKGLVKRLQSAFKKLGFPDFNIPVQDFLRQVSLRKIANCGPKTIGKLNELLHAEGIGSEWNNRAPESMGPSMEARFVQDTVEETLRQQRVAHKEVSTKGLTLQNLVDKVPRAPMSSSEKSAMTRLRGSLKSVKPSGLNTLVADFLERVSFTELYQRQNFGLRSIEVLNNLLRTEGVETGWQEILAEYAAPLVERPLNPAAFNPELPSHRHAAYRELMSLHEAHRASGLKGELPSLRVTDIKGQALEVQTRGGGIVCTTEVSQARPAIGKDVAIQSSYIQGESMTLPSETITRTLEPIYETRFTTRTYQLIGDTPAVSAGDLVLPRTKISYKPEAVFQDSMKPEVRRVVWDEAGLDAAPRTTSSKTPAVSKKPPTEKACAVSRAEVIRGTVDFSLTSESSGAALAPQASLPSKLEVAINQAVRNPFVHFAAVAATVVAGTEVADVTSDLLKDAGVDGMAADYTGVAGGTALAAGVARALKLGRFAPTAVFAHTVSHAFEANPHLSTPGSTIDTAYQVGGHTASAANSTLEAVGTVTIGPFIAGVASEFLSPEEQVAMMIGMGKSLVGSVSAAVRHIKSAGQNVAELIRRFNYSKGDSGLGHHYRFDRFEREAPASAPTPASAASSVPAMTAVQAREALESLGVAAASSSAVATARRVAASLGGLPVASDLISGATDLGQIWAANVEKSLSGSTTQAVSAAVSRMAAPAPAPVVTAPVVGDIQTPEEMRAGLKQLVAAVTASPAASAAAETVVNAFLAVQGLSVPAQVAKPALAAPPAAIPAPAPPKPAPRSAYVEPVQNTLNYALFPTLLGVNNLQVSLFDAGPSFSQPTSSSLFASTSSSTGLFNSYSPFAGRGDSFASNLWDLWSVKSPFSSNLSFGGSSSAFSSASSSLGGIGSVSGARTGLSWDSLCSLAAAEAPRSLGILPGYLSFASNSEQVFKLTVEYELRDHGMEFMSPYELYRKVQDHVYSMKLGSGIMMSYGDFCSKVRSSGLVESYIMFNRHSNFRISRTWGEIGGVAATVGLIKDLPDSATHDASRYVICFPSDDGKAPFTEAQLKQIARENADAFFKHKTTPFFSLDFAAKTHLVPIIHPAFQNTLTGKVISVLDYILKGLLNGGTYDQAFIESWFRDMNFDDGYLRAHLIDLKKYCKEHVPGLSYLSLREMMKRAGIDEDSLKASGSHYSQPFKTSFRIISKIEKIERDGNVFIVYPDFDVDYTIELMPDYEVYINRYHQEHGQYPEEYEKTKRCYESFKSQLKEYLKKLPICRDLMKMLGVINFYSYFYNTLQAMGKVPDLDAQPEVEHYATPPAFPPLPVRSYQVYPLEVTIGNIIEKLHAMEAAKSGLEKIDDLLKPMFSSDEIEELPGAVVDRVKVAVTDIIVTRLQASVPGLTADTVNTDDVDKLAEIFFIHFLRNIQANKKFAETQLNELVVCAKRILSENIGPVKLSRHHEIIESLKSAMKKHWAESPEGLEADLAQLLPKYRFKVDGQIFATKKLLAGCEALIRQHFKYEEFMLALPGYIVRDKQNQKDYANLGQYSPSDHDAVRAELAEINKRLPIVEAQLASYSRAEERREFKEACGDEAIVEALFAAADSKNQAAFEAIIESAAKARAIQLYIHFLTKNEDVLSQINRFTYHFLENMGMANQVLDDEKQYCHSTISFNAAECKDGVRLDVKGGCGVKIPNITSKPIHNPRAFSRNLSRLSQATAESWATMEHAGTIYAVTNMRVKDHISVSPADYLGLFSTPTRAGDATAEQISQINALITQYALKAKEKNKLEAALLKLAVDPSGSRAIHHAAVILEPRAFIDFCRLDFTQLDQRDSFGHLALHSAATVGNAGVVTAILTMRKTQLNAVTLSGDTALIAAVRNGRKEVVDCLLQQGADANHQPPSELFALYVAIQSNFPDIALLLLEKVSGLNLGLALANKMTALHLALELGMKAVAVQLIQRNAPLNGRRKSDGMTPFHVAIAHGDQELIKMMLDKKVSVDEALDSGKTALHIAAEKGHLLVVRQLLAAGANPAAQTLDGDTPLATAIKNGHKEVALELAAISPINVLNKAKQTASLLAVENNLCLVADLLWSRGEDPELKDERGLNSIYYLLRQGDLARFEKLLIQNKIKNIHQEILGESLSAIAARYGYFSIVKSLKFKAAKFSSDLTRDEAVFEIIMAVQNDEVGILRLWQTLEPSKRGFEALIPVGEYKGKTLAYLAAERGSMRCFKVLRASLTDEDIIKQEILVAAIRSRSLELVELSAIRDFQQALDTEGNNALHLAVLFGSREIMEYLLRCGFKTVVRNKNKQTAFHIALLNNDAYLLKRLMKETPKDEWPRDLFEAINSQTSGSILELLKEKGYPESEKNLEIAQDKERELESKRQSAVLRMPSYQRLKLQIDRLFKVQNIDEIAVLIERFPLIVEAYRSEAGETLLLELLNRSFKPAEKIKAPVVEAVSEDEGSSSDESEEESSEVDIKKLYMSFKKRGLNLKLYVGKHNPLLDLIDTGISDEQACYRYSLLAEVFPEAMVALVTDLIDGHSVLKRALHNHKVKLFERMLQSRVAARPGEWDAEMIPLHEAILADRYDLAISLLSDSTVNKANRSLRTPLMLAALRGNLRLMQALLSQGANPDALDNEGDSALHYALLAGHEAAALFLLPVVRHKNKRNRLGVSCLSQAAAKGLLNVVRAITQEGNYTKDVNVLGQNALHMAALKGKEKVVEYLLSQGFDIDQVEKPVRPSKIQRGFQRTPLQLAALSGQLQTVIKLIELGADMLKEDEVGKTFFEYVLLGKNRELWKLVRNLVREKYSKHVSYLVLAAAQANQSDALLELLTEGVDVNAVGRLGNSSLHLAALNNSTASVKLLLSRITAIDYRNNLGETALHSAAQRGHVAIIGLLKAAGASLDLLNNERLTALYLACKEGRAGAVVALTRYGANFGLRDPLGISPAQIALMQGHFSIAAHLARQGDNSLLDEEISKLPKIIQARLKAHPSWLVQCQGLYLENCRLGRIERTKVDACSVNSAKIPGTLFNHRAAVPLAETGARAEIDPVMRGLA